MAFPTFSVRQLFAALCSSAGQDFASVGSRHSFAETVLFAPLPFLRLICSQHSQYPPFIKVKFHQNIIMEDALPVKGNILQIFGFFYKKILLNLRFSVSSLLKTPL